MNEKKTCPICGSEMTSRLIDYMDWSEGHVLVIREVPVQECRDFGHQFMSADTAKEIELLFERDQKGTLKPQEILSTPVLSLNAQV
ncbi:MAG: type II toxin-antitoxin system MqsA family antitoxin [Chloroflexota bacterium]|nr:type II toxin-antitoxin system MqsA family antitoxin [Chloroflexota bacterium]